MNEDNQYYAGVDIGSVSIKAALVSGRRLIAYELVPSGGSYRDTAQKVLDSVLVQGRV